MRSDRAVWVALGLVALGFAASQLFRHGPNGLPWLPGCLFHRFTGWDCPGCGMTRAAHACLHGEIGRAFRFNPLGMVLLPLAAAGLALETAGWVRGRPLPLSLRLPPRGIRALLAVIVVFWVLRNVPVWPFLLLAPP